MSSSAAVTPVAGRQSTTTRGLKKQAPVSENVLFDPLLFLLYFPYIILFPLSEVVRWLLMPFVSTKLYASLSWHACTPSLLYWIYFACFFNAPNRDNLGPLEVLPPAILIIIIALDTATALSNPNIASLLRLQDLNISTMKQANTVRRSLEIGVLDSAVRMVQLATVTPHSETSKIAREHLRSFGITVPVPNTDYLDQFHYLCYDVADNDVVEPGPIPMSITNVGSVDGIPLSPNLLPNSLTESEEKKPQDSAHKLTLAEYDVGESYVKQCTSHPQAVKLEAVADQIIWGLHPVVARSCGLCARFFDQKKIPTTIVSIFYVGFLAALPSILRAARGGASWKEFNHYEVGLSIAYIVLIIYGAIVMCVLWGLLIQMYEQEYARSSFLTLLLDPQECSIRSLPVFDFRKPSHIMGWYQLHEYVTGFSARTVQYFANRFLIYVAALVACIAFVVAQYTTDNLKQQGLFGSFTVITFLSFILFFFYVVAFGFLGNIHINSWARRFAKIKCDLQESLHLIDRAIASGKPEPANGPSHADQIQQIEKSLSLIDTVAAFIAERPRTSLLGFTLDASFVSLLASGAAVLYGYLFPIFLAIFTDP